MAGSSEACQWRFLLDRMSFISDNMHMHTIRKTAAYAAWINGLHDRHAVLRIETRIRRLELGNPGDMKALGGGVSELRIDYGPGYRVYFTRRDGIVIILLAGGDKRTQDQDIETARRLARDL